MGRRMVWLIPLGLVLPLALGGTALADIVHLRNGTSIWASETEEDGDEVIITRGGVTQRVPKASVDRIEKKSTNLPDYPVAAPPSAPPGPAISVGPGGPVAPPGAPGGPPPGGAPGGQIPLPGVGPAGPSPGVPGGPPGGEVSGPPVPSPPGASPRQR